MQLLLNQCSKGKFVCVGLDSKLTNIPKAVQVLDPDNKNAFMGLAVEATLLKFNQRIIDATCDIVCAYKPNSAFYEEWGPEGMSALKKTVDYIHEVAPDVIVIYDCKRGDIDSTNLGYVGGAFQYLGADAITIHPYLGREACQVFLDQRDKGIFVLCRTSNSGAEEFQDLHVITDHTKDVRVPLYNYVARRVNDTWNRNGNCGLVVGATYPRELREVREIVGKDIPILIPGIGAQGGDLQATIENAGRQFIINSSRGIIFASKNKDFAEAARRETEKLHKLITIYRGKDLNHG